MEWDGIIIALALLGAIWLFYLIFGESISTSIERGNAAYREKYPEKSVSARVVSRRTDTQGGSDPFFYATPGSLRRFHFGNGVSTDYFVTFELQTGERLEFEVSGTEYGQLVEGDKGILTSQGGRYRGFVRDPKPGNEPVPADEFVPHD